MSGEAYTEFLKSKEFRIKTTGWDIDYSLIHPLLFPFQKDVVRWAAKKGRGAVFLDTGLGKAQPTDEPVLTPAGWRAIGDLAVGDQVIAVDGSPTCVLGVYPQGRRPVVRMTFNDGASVRCDEDHLWMVATDLDISRGRPWRMLTARQLLEQGLKLPARRMRWRVPVVRPVQHPQAALAIDPYVLGALLGDGSFRLPSGPVLTTTDDKIAAEIKSRLPIGMRMTPFGRADRAPNYRMVVEGRTNWNKTNPYLGALKAWGLHGRLSYKKFIPPEYLTASAAQRLDLLRGLMDTDGYVAADGTVQFGSSSKGLANGVLALVRSLGGIAYQTLKRPSYTHKGERRVGREHHILTIAMPDGTVPFLLPRKVKRCSDRYYAPQRKIVSVEPVGEAECVCIAVAHPAQLYVTCDYIVTHNTFIQLEWARLIGKQTLIIAPLSVARQTIQEGKKINVAVRYVRKQAEMDDGINITNYEMIEHFSRDCAEAIVLDESSILKSLSGKTKEKLIRQFEAAQFKLCCTATPAPNDYTELGNHAEFLNVCSMQEMLAMFFINANKEHTFIYENRVITKKGSNKGGQEWRIKHHAEEPFFRWLSRWAMVMTKPSDLGYGDDGFVLPPLNITPVFVPADDSPDAGRLFFMGLSGLGHRVKVRTRSIAAKLRVLEQIVSRNGYQTIIWCGLDKESRAVSQLLGGAAVEVCGSDDPEIKAAAFEDFQDGKYRNLVTKNRIGGFGMNFQNASQMIFFGMSDSWETYYQGVRREWRFGQTRPVDIYLLLSDFEREIYDNVLRKDKQAQRLKTKMIELLKEPEMAELHRASMNGERYEEDVVRTADWVAMLGDSCVRMREIGDNSVDLSIYSPPFADLFVYSNTDRDLGNCRGWDEFFRHYEFIVRENLRVTRPGRLSCVHTSDIPAMANRDGYIGLRDFPGRVIGLHEECGWTFVGRCFVQKNPQAQAIRVKSKSLLFIQINKDSSHSRPALVDQILIFKKPGENRAPVTPVQNGELNNETWISWAHGIWTDINETDTLQYYHARGKDDEKHICPLQLGTIERCVKLYSNPGETVLTPFMGIGSEAFVAVKSGRKAIGIELKRDYFDVAVANLKSLQRTLFQ